MMVLVTCEESQTVCKAFRERGHVAYSNDILDCSGGHPEWHMKCDAFEAIISTKWDLIIMHPPCTYVAVSGNGTYYNSPKRKQAALWTAILWEMATNLCDKVAMENPVGVLNTYFPRLPKPQYIQPWWFGHGETKKTGIWRHNLPELKPTNIVEGREQRIWKMSPGEQRSKERSKTYPGIADAFAEQWG